MRIFFLITFLCSSLVLFAQDDADVLLEEQSPHCPITAIVEQDERAAYFYLWGDEETRFGVKAVWIRNLQKAPKGDDEKMMKIGVPPMMPENKCLNKGGLPKLEEEKLSIIWLEEGDAAALFYDDEVIAIIPSWSDMGNFPGYAKECREASAFAWPLSEGNALYARIDKAKSSWESWARDENPFWIMQPKQIEYYENMFGESEKYYAIEANEWPPVGLFVKHDEDQSFFSTVCLGLRPMPQIESSFENPDDYNYIELGLLIKSDIDESLIQSIGNSISGTANLPWQNITWLGEGHTVNFTGFSHENMNGVLLTDKLKVLPQMDIPQYQKTKIKYYWMVPISISERDFAIKNGSAKLIELLDELGEEVFNLDRKLVKE